MTDFKKQTVAVLKAELTKLGLSTTGKKDDLVQRLEEHYESIANTNNKKITATNNQKTIGGTTVTEANGTTKAVGSPTLVTSHVSNESTTGNSAGIKSPAAVTTNNHSSSSPGASMTFKDATQASSNSGTSPTALTQGLSEREKKELRMKRFGEQVVENPLTKKNHQEQPALEVDPEVLKARQARFGAINPEAEKVLLKSEEEKKRLQRLERFGTTEEELNDSKKVFYRKHKSNHRFKSRFHPHKRSSNVYKR